MKTLLAFLFTLVAAPALAQTSPCTAPQTGLQITSTARNALVMSQPEFSKLFNGKDVLTDVDVSAFAKGADPNTATPIAGVVFAKSALTLVDAATFCYRVVVPFLGLVTPNVEYDLALRNRGNVFDASGVSTLQWGAWSVARIPFGRSAAPAAPTVFSIP